MAINPIVFTERVVRSFLRYQMTAYPFADPRLYAQMRRLLSLDETRRSPLLKGPYITLSRSFRLGVPIETLIKEGVFHPHMRQRIPEEITHLYGHQEEAIRAIHGGRTTLISTGTGSGKTECFLYPIVSKCLELRDEASPPGISAVIVYPMNALAEDQLGRLRSLLAGTRIPFGMYVGKTPEREGEVAGIRLPNGASRADYDSKLAEIRRENRSETVFPPEEVCSREVMRTPGSQPRILLTNVKQLELLLTRQRDVELFSGARLDFLIFDETHTFTGAQGAETACLIRRLKSFCNHNSKETVCIATSATIVDKDNPNAAQDFASRFFGVSKDEIATVGEAYEPHVWQEERFIPPLPKRDPATILNNCVKAVDDEQDPSAAVRGAYHDLASRDLPDGAWSSALNRALSKNELVFQLNELLSKPIALHELPAQLEKKINRKTSDAEILAWLALGAAARIEERPLLRPVVHGFIRGISGAVVSFPRNEAEPQLWLSAEDEIEARGEKSQYAHFPVTTCTTCGQHYFVAFLKDFEFTGSSPGGGDAEGDTSVWEPLEEAQGGRRVVLTDRIVGAEEDEIEEHARTAPVHFCRHCGAAHPGRVSRCLHCGTPGESVILYAVQQREESPGYLSRCLSCQANGRRIVSRYREPARPVRATNVADVHILAQDMIQHSERPRLLVFCDNRQDAAFQAGWMKDHARRFRLRALMAEGIKNAPISVGDLSLFLDETLDKNESLSRALVPEVWRVVRKEGSGGRHGQERRKFLRIQILREVTLSPRQAIGLEPWGRLKIEYEGLDTSHSWIQEHAQRLTISPEELHTGIVSLLDSLRRKQVLYDPEREIFSKYWQDGDLEIQQGYLNQFGHPQGTKLRRTSSEASGLVVPWISESGETAIRQLIKKWGVTPENADEISESLFQYLVNQGLLKPVTLKGARGNPLPNVSGLYQIDADRLRINANQGVWRCNSCRRRMTGRTPHKLCPAWRCEGTLNFVQEDPDNYDLQLLDQNYSMLLPEEHTAMVPPEERERLENLFKGKSDAINTFVCTPTLELGVDIGQLDAVLMRNVPPLSANYWQRAGRAGRRHRMAVNLTYCRPVSHDRAYFSDPLKLLTGRVDPPAFNLRNDLMVSKHVHAAVLTRLHQYVRDGKKSQENRDQIQETLRNCLPDRVSSYLFDEGRIRDTSFNFGPLYDLIVKNRMDLLDSVEKAFHQNWPNADASVTNPAVLNDHIINTVGNLEEVVSRLRKRLHWALEQINRLNKVRSERGVLEKEDDILFRRCDLLVKRLKGVTRRSRREAEGFDEVNTFGVLAAEGFLPGYGLEVGSVLGTAEIPFWRSGAREFYLPRPPSIALREFVPGNLIYANGNRFVARRFHRSLDEQSTDIPVFEISTERQAVQQTEMEIARATLGSSLLPAIAVCDVDLVHQSHISDEEELRFQMGVSVLGLERDQHKGGVAYQWGSQGLHHRLGVRFRLVNIGASNIITRTAEYGYPFCMICGQSVSPLSSLRQRTHFNASHREHCGNTVQRVGFYADLVADVLSLPSCANQVTAYSIMEVLRFAATRVLDMHMEDLQVLVIGHVDREDVDALLWDPMPGGSGLLDQICEHFDEIATIAREVVQNCPSDCENSCVDCLQTFRNAYYHKYLNRRLALELIDEWGTVLAESHQIPPKQPSAAPKEGEYPVNIAEAKLRDLLKAAGFSKGIRGEQILLDRFIGSTTPDVIYRAEHHDQDEGVCIYLDGLSENIHGNAQTAKQDQRIRTWLRNNGYEVLEIAASDLDDKVAMIRHFRKLAGYLSDPELRESIKSDSSWFAKGNKEETSSQGFSLQIVHPTAQEKYVSSVPLVPLKAAAGYFGEPQSANEGNWDWVQIESGHKLRKGMFVAQVVGHSMEPKIPDGSYCLFSSPVAGTRQGKTVLVQLKDEADPETGERYTVKRYKSEKTQGKDETWRHIKISLLPINCDYRPIELKCEDEGQVKVIAELVEVLGS